jgi:hypothetical protein
MLPQQDFVQRNNKLIPLQRVTYEVMIRLPKHIIEE